MPDLKSELIERGKAKQAANYLRIDERCSKDPMYWLRNWTATYDPHAVKKGVNPVKPFPDWAYFDHLMYFLSRPKDYPRIFIPKSREMLTSWIVAGYITWLCQYTPFAQCICQTEKESKAVKLVGYSKVLYDNQPEWLRKMHCLRGGYTKVRQGRDKELELAFGNSAELIGIPSGPDQIPSFHPSLFVIDEAGLLTAAGQSYDLAHPVCSQIIVISTARPGWFADMTDNNSIDMEATKQFVAMKALDDSVSA